MSSEVIARPKPVVRSSKAKKVKKTHFQLTNTPIVRAMAKSRTFGWKKNSIVKLKVAVEKLQRSLSLTKRLASGFHDLNHDSTSVPEDVKEGHFAVIAYDDGQPKRYVVALSYLTHPTFLRLLEQAAEEFGFDHDGALTIPCRSSELESILMEQWEELELEEERCVNGGMGWESCKTMVESC